MTAVSGGKTFVGFGFGPIQSGLFLFEAYQSGHFRRFVVSEVDAKLVEAVRRNGNRYSINVARKDRIDRFEQQGIEIYNPCVPADREKILAAIAESDEMATSLPSVDFFDRGGETSVAGILAAGLGRRSKPRPTVIYAAENHNHAAEILLERLRGHAKPGSLDSVQTLNTVIGKMSGVIAEADVIGRMKLATITPDIARAVLVEEFNRILISRVSLADYRRGIDVFQEKDDLLPFEEAKLYGHNAIHAMIAYLADLKGLATIADAAGDKRLMAVAREAFIEESGAALIRRHASLGDRLFTPDGYREYADDLLERMVCPNLNDLVSRVGRDHARKLGYDDRLYGTMRIALDQGVRPKRLALGAAAGLISLVKRQGELKSPLAGLPRTAAELTESVVTRVLAGLWGVKADARAEELIGLTTDALKQLRSEGWA